MMQCYRKDAGKFRLEGPELEDNLLHENTQMVLEGRALAPDGIFLEQEWCPEQPQPTSWVGLSSSRRKPLLLI